MNYSAARVAYDAISKHNKENIVVTKVFNERWVVSMAEIFSKENKILNWKLGITDINYKGNTNQLMKNRLK